MSWLEVAPIAILLAGAAFSGGPDKEYVRQKTAPKKIDFWEYIEAEKKAEKKRKKSKKKSKQVDLVKKAHADLLKEVKRRAENNDAD